MRRRSGTPFFVALSTIVAVGSMAGCSSSFQPNAVETAQSSAESLSGTVHRGQSPISGAQIYLYSAGTGGGVASLIQAEAVGNTYEDGNGNYYVTTDAEGNFSISASSNCRPGSQLYVVAVDGGASAEGNAAQIAGLGECPAAGNPTAQVPYVVLNEGLNGDAGGMVPQGQISTPVNVLEACVTSAGPSSNSCTQLFEEANSIGAGRGTTAHEPQPVFSIAYHPMHEGKDLFGLQATSRPDEAIGRTLGLTTSMANLALPVLPGTKP